MSNVHSTLTELFTNIANAIRSRTGSTETIVADNFPSAIEEIETGTTLPELTNEGSAEDLMSGKELINSEGNTVTGTFTIDNELTTQEDLISQITTALAGKAGSSGSGGSSVDICTVTITNGDGIFGPTSGTMCYMDSNLSSVAQEFSTSDDTIALSVVKGSVIYISSSGTSVDCINIENGSLLHYLDYMAHESYIGALVISIEGNTELTIVDENMASSGN